MKILYFLFTVVAWLISRLPFALLYGLSDVTSLLLYYVIRYRRKVVNLNLHRAFPEKSEKELRAIERKYFRHLADIILETIKIQGMTAQGIRKRLSVLNYDVIEIFRKQRRSIIVASGHLGNWEWFGPYWSTFHEFNSYAVVKPLTDEFFEQYMVRTRLKFAEKGLIDFRKAFREMIAMKNDLCFTLILGDQTPTKDEINYWTTFLNQETAVFLGIEKIAKFLDQPVVFMDLYRTKRGHYQVEFSLITDTPKETAEYEITEAHVRKLEEVIRKRPYNWLWSHRRWKHKREN